MEAKSKDPGTLQREGEIDALTLVRRHGVILDWGTEELPPETTKGFRDMLGRRAVPGWETS